MSDKIDGRKKIRKHIDLVQYLFKIVLRDLYNRSSTHDLSKFEHPEIDFFEKQPVNKFNYGSKEYDESLSGFLKPAIDHHHQNNRHHPEFFRYGIAEMNLLDLLEMAIDWRVTGKENGKTFEETLELTQKKYKFSNEIKLLLYRTILFIDEYGI